MDQPDQKPPAEGPTQALLKRLLARNLSQTEIARRTGITQPKLSRWANGETAAGADDALRLKQLEDELIAQETSTQPQEP